MAPYPPFHIFPDAQTLAEGFALYLNMAVHEKKGRYSLALSGGSTPKLLFRHLAESYRDRLAWEKIDFFWGDERCVPPGHEESNYKMTAELLLEPLGIPQEQIFRIRGEEDPEAEARRYSEEIGRRLPVSQGWPVFDLVLLGLGEDGHTASIFPNQLSLLDSQQICAVGVHPGSGQQRVTLTGKVINQARDVVFLVNGESKAQKVLDVMVNREKSLPAAHIQPHSGQLLWFLDEAAAKELPIPLDPSGWIPPPGSPWLPEE